MTLGHLKMAYFLLQAVILKHHEPNRFNTNLHQFRVAEYPIGWPTLKSQKQNICTEIMRHSKFSNYCVGVVDIQESVFPKFQAFSYRFTVVMDKWSLVAKYLIIYRCLQEITFMQFNLTQCTLTKLHVYNVLYESNCKNCILNRWIILGVYSHLFKYKTFP